ncbi:YigZ family protein [Ligilactobacillus sp. LYQ139]|uniref:YigZ family protein n=1 Tax=Ligilactobacillus sp. LYQ139 TaxID=3378800 RepID=UPI003852624F
MTPYYTITTPGKATLTIKKSIFICRITRTTSPKEATAFIERVNTTERKARHNCFATVIGDNDQFQRMSDNGEPSGTAGVPILSTLQQRHLHDVTAVITRYFGGIKLGTGGLIRAYRKVTSTAINATTIMTKRSQQTITVTTDYARFQTLQNYLQQHHIPLLTTDYTTAVTTTITLPANQFPAFNQTIKNLLSGHVTLHAGNIQPTYVPANITH